MIGGGLPSLLSQRKGLLQGDVASLAKWTSPACGASRAKLRGSVLSDRKAALVPLLDDRSRLLQRSGRRRWSATPAAGQARDHRHHPDCEKQPDPGSDGIDMYQTQDPQDEENYRNGPKHFYSPPVTGNGSDFGYCRFLISMVRSEALFVACSDWPIPLLGIARPFWNSVNLPAFLFQYNNFVNHGSLSEPIPRGELSRSPAHLPQNIDFASPFWARATYRKATP